MDSAKLGVLSRDPTYAVARSMAAPVLHAMDTSSIAAKSRNSDKLETSTDETLHEGPDTPRSSNSDSSSGLDTPIEGGRCEPHHLYTRTLTHS